MFSVAAFGAVVARKRRLSAEDSFQSAVSTHRVIGWIIDVHHGNAAGIEDELAASGSVFHYEL